jgi:hypothetical protein
MTTLLEQEIKQVMQNFIHLKKQTCEKNNGPQDLAPMYHLTLDNDEIMAAIAPIDMHPTEALMETLPLILFNQKPKFTMFMVEGYMQERETMPTQHIRGELEKDFKENAATTIRESITVHGIDKEGTQVMGVVSYKYDDFGMPVFDEPKFAEIVGDMMEANVPMIFALSYQYVKSMLN